MSHLLDILGIPSAMTIVMRRFVRWLGHTARMGPERLPRQALFGKMPDRAGVWANKRDVPYRMLTHQARQQVQALPGVDPPPLGEDGPGP